MTEAEFIYFFQMENVSSLEQTSCACDLPLSSIFTIATTFYLPVNMVDFSTVFTEIDLLDNASVFTMVILMLSVYILLVVWARRKDKTDIIKVLCAFRKAKFWIRCSISCPFPFFEDTFINSH